MDRGAAQFRIDPFVVVPMVDNPSVELISFRVSCRSQCPGVLVGTGTAKKCWNESESFGYDTVDVGNLTTKHES